MRGSGPIIKPRGWRAGFLLGLAILLGAAPLTGQDFDLTILPGPTPECQYQCTIAPALDDAVPYWPPLVQAPADAPNVLLVLIDDVASVQPAPLAARCPHPTWTG